MTPHTRRAPRTLVAAALTAAVLAGSAFTATSWAHPADDAVAPQEMKAHLTRHVSEHLDELSARLQIKASQEPAWQAFATAFRDVVTSMPLHERTGKTTEPDAAALSREHAERAMAHAQRLARMADATAKLQQSLGADQRLVLNEAVRHFARDHMHPGAVDHGMMGHWHMGHDGAGSGPMVHGMRDHCEEEDGPMMEHHGRGPMGYGPMDHEPPGHNWPEPGTPGAGKDDAAAGQGSKETAPH